MYDCLHKHKKLNPIKFTQAAQTSSQMLFDMHKITSVCAKNSCDNGNRPQTVPVYHLKTFSADLPRKSLVTLEYDLY